MTIALAFRRSFLPTTVLSSEFYNESYFSVLVQISILGVFLWSTVTFINDESYDYRLYSIPVAILIGASLEKPQSVSVSCKC